MDYCGTRGIPHSHFLGGRRRWTDEDQDKALAWARLQQHTCPRCGTLPEEWVEPDGRTVPDPPYIAEAARCYGCAEVEAATADLRKHGGDLDGVTVQLRRYDPLTDDEE